MTDYRSMAFYPLMLPLTTGPGTIAVMISLGFGRSRRASVAQELHFVAMILLAAVVTAATIYICFVYADRVERRLGRICTDIAVRLSAFILFCVGGRLSGRGQANCSGRCR